jgi:hypothetical protein
MLIKIGDSYINPEHVNGVSLSASNGSSIYIYGQTIDLNGIAPKEVADLVNEAIDMKTSQAIGYSQRRRQTGGSVGG